MPVFAAKVHFWSRILKLKAERRLDLNKSKQSPPYAYCRFSEYKIVDCPVPFFAYSVVALLIDWCCVKDVVNFMKTHVSPSVTVNLP